MCIGLSPSAQLVVNGLEPEALRDLVDELKQLLTPDPPNTWRIRGQKDASVMMVTLGYLAIWMWMTPAELRRYNREYNKRCKAAINVTDLVNPFDYGGAGDWLM